MTRIVILIIIILVTLLIGNEIDKRYFVKRRVLSHRIWEYKSGDKTAGEIIDMRYAKFSTDTLVIQYSQNRILFYKVKYQRFNFIKLYNLTNKTNSIYTLKGASWFEFIYQLSFSK